MRTFINIIVYGCVLLFLYWLVFRGGPLGLYRCSRGKTRAQEGSQRKELVQRVQALLPQAKEDTILFSMHEKRSVRGGSHVTVVNTTYTPLVFVADGERLWVIPVQVGKRHSYQLGNPIPLTSEFIKEVSLRGKAGQDQYIFSVETRDGTQEIPMAIQPFLYQKNRHCPVDLVQEEACRKMTALAQRLAFLSCHMSVEDLEEDRRKDRAIGYATIAGFIGMLGLMFAFLEDANATITLFIATLVPFALMLRNRQIPKISAIVVLVQAILSYQFLK